MWRALNIAVGSILLIKSLEAAQLA